MIGKSLDVVVVRRVLIKRKHEGVEYRGDRGGDKDGRWENSKLYYK